VRCRIRPPPFVVDALIALATVPAQEDGVSVFIEGVATGTENHERVGTSDLAPGPGQRPFIERRARKIANARSVTVSLALTFVALAFVGAIVIEIVDGHDFSSFGSAVWWNWISSLMPPSP
jgi:hypothetical protein